MAHPYEKANHAYTKNYPTKIGLAVRKSTKTKSATLKILNPLKKLPSLPLTDPKVFKRGQK